MDAVDVVPLLLRGVHHLEDPERSPRERQDLGAVAALLHHAVVVDAVDPLELVAVLDLDALGQVIGVRAGDEANAIGQLPGRHVPPEELLRARKPHVEVVVARQICDSSVGPAQKFPHGVHESRVPLEAGLELLRGDFVRDLGRPLPLDLDLQQVENVPVEDELDLRIRPRQAVVVAQKLGETVVVEEILQNVQLPTAPPGAQVKV